MLERDSWLRALTVLLVIIASWYLLGQVFTLAQQFSDLIMLFFLAWLLAFTLSPVARLLTGILHIPRALAVTLVYLALLVGLFGGGALLLPIVAVQLSQLGENLGTYTEQLSAWVASVQAELARRDIYLDLPGFYRQQDFASQIERVGTLLIQNAFGIVTGIAGVMLSTFLVLVLSFYIMLDGRRLTERVIMALPARMHAEPRFLLESMERTFGGYIRGQLIQCLIYGIGTAVVMLAFGLNYVVVCSLFAAAMMLVPFVGPGVAVLPPMLIAALQGSWATMIPVVALLVALQQVVINIVAPRVLGRAVGLPPLLVLAALLLGAKIGGVVGAIFGVPIFGVLYAMFLFVYRRSARYEPETANSGSPGPP